MRRPLTSEEIIKGDAHVALRQRASATGFFGAFDQDPVGEALYVERPDPRSYQDMNAPVWDPEAHEEWRQQAAALRKHDFEVASEVETHFIDLLREGEHRQIQALTRDELVPMVGVDYRSQFRQAYTSACEYNPSLRAYAELADLPAEQFGVASDTNQLYLRLPREDLSQRLPGLTADLLPDVVGESPIANLLHTARVRLDEAAEREKWERIDDQVTHYTEDKERMAEIAPESLADPLFDSTLRLYDEEFVENPYELNEAPLPVPDQGQVIDMAPDFMGPEAGADQAMSQIMNQRVPEHEFSVSMNDVSLSAIVDYIATSGADDTSIRIALESDGFEESRISEIFGALSLKRYIDSGQ